MCTTPVPSSVVTSSDRMTRNASAGAELLGVGQVGQQRLVPAPGQLRAGQLADDRGAFQLALVGGLPVAGQDVALAVLLQHGVADVGADRDGLVGRQRPRRRRPGQQPLAGLQLEPDGDRRVLPVPVDVVVHPQLVVGQRGLAPPAVRQHLEALVDQALVPQLLERPHDALHVGGVQRLVVVVEVDPAGLPGHVVAPLVGVAQHRFAAGLVELLDPHRDDLGLAGDAEQALGLDLGGQAVAVPAEPALDPAALHGAEPRHHVLDVAGDQVPVVRQAVGERRAVVEDELVCQRALLHRLAEGVVGCPVGEHAFLQIGKAGLGRHSARGLASGLGGLGAGINGHRRYVLAALAPGRSARGRRARSRAGVPRYHLACRRPGSEPSPRPLVCPAVTGRTRPVLLRPLGRLGAELALSSGSSPVIAGSSPCDQSLAGVSNSPPASIPALA